VANGYTKLFASIVHSTIWRAPDHVRLVWITLLAIADRDGTVEASVPGLADAARVTLDQCVAALEHLSAPDQWSRTPDNEGRRISAIAGGWQILNHGMYRDRMTADVKRQQSAERQARFRLRNAKVTPVTHTEAEAEAEAEATAEATVVPKNSSGKETGVAAGGLNGRHSGLDRVLAAYASAKAWRWGDHPTPATLKARQRLGELLRKPPSDRIPAHWVDHLCVAVRRYVAGGDDWTLQKKHPLGVFLNDPDPFLPPCDALPEDLEDPIPVNPSSAARGPDAAT